MDRVYGEQPGKGRRVLPWADIVLFLFCIGGAAYIVWIGTGASKALDLVLAGLLAFVGAGAAMNALEHQRDTAN